MNQNPQTAVATQPVQDSNPPVAVVLPTSPNPVNPPTPPVVPTKPIRPDPRNLRQEKKKVAKFVLNLRKTHQYEILSSRVAQLKVNVQTQPLIDRFKLIDIDNLSTLDECKQVQKEITDLLQLIHNTFPYNPYLTLPSDKANLKNKTLGSIPVDFNGVYVPLSHVLMLPNSTPKDREWTLKQHLNHWLVEAQTNLGNQIKQNEMDMESLWLSKVGIFSMTLKSILLYGVWILAVGALLFLDVFAPLRAGQPVTFPVSFSTVLIILITLVAGYHRVLSQHMHHYPMSLINVFGKELDANQKSLGILPKQRRRLETRLLKKARQGVGSHTPAIGYSVLSAYSSIHNKVESFISREKVFYRQKYGFFLFVDWISFLSILALVTIFFTLTVL